MTCRPSCGRSSARWRRPASRPRPALLSANAIAESAALIVGQSGGPTAAINASLYGVLLAAREVGVKRVLGMRFGIEGLLAGDFVDLSQQSPALLERLRSTPG